jgi:hypothetical protein
VKWLRRIAWAGLALIGVWVLAWAIVPPVLKSQAQQRLSDALTTARRGGREHSKGTL